MMDSIMIAATETTTLCWIFWSAESPRHKEDRQRGVPAPCVEGGNDRLHGDDMVEGR